MSEPTHTPPQVLSLDQLADLLQVPMNVAGTIAIHHALPHVTIAGEPRFLSHQVLAWLDRVASPSGSELLPSSPSADVAERPVTPVTTHALPAAGAGDHVWINAEITSALADGSADAGRNLDRLKIRDALLELNDELLPLVARLSEGRLHPDPNERSRTSPWRLDLDAEGAITVMSIAWGAGTTAAPQFADRPRLQVEVTHGLLRVALETDGRTVELPPREIDSLARRGLAVDAGPGSNTIRGAARVYTLPPEGVALSVVREALSADLEQLVPILSQII